MSDIFSIQLNGQIRHLPETSSPSDLASIVNILGLIADRIAVEHNGEIVPRKAWEQVQIADGDRLEIVHFVGGGVCAETVSSTSCTKR